MNGPTMKRVALELRGNASWFSTTIGFPFGTTKICCENNPIEVAGENQFHFDLFLPATQLHRASRLTLTHDKSRARFAIWK